MFRILSAAVFLFLSASLQSDAYHNIPGFFGERAAGLGGAYTAVSDDVAGAFYNPGGLAFVQNTYYSVNASSYRTISEKHSNLFGPGQNYKRVSRNYMPNFIGFVRNVGKLSFGFTLANPVNENFDQSDRIVLPLYRRNLTQMAVSVSQENFRLQAGPSIAYALTDKLGIGLTTYYMYDSAKTVSSSNMSEVSGNVITLMDQERRRTSGIIPILGLQYMLNEKLSFGASMKKTMVTGGNISTRSNVTVAGRSGGPSSITSQAGSQMGAIIVGTDPILTNPSTYKVPEVTETRFGTSFFASKRLMISGDLIHTSGYKLAQSNFMYDPSRKMAVFGDPYSNSLKQMQTLNYAVGVEFYATESIVLRFGHFSNLANSEKINWLNAAAEAAVIQATSNRGAPATSITLPLDSSTAITLPQKREQHISLKGYTFGIGFETAKNSFSIIVSAQSGRGIATIDRNQLPTVSTYNDVTFYVSGGTKN